MAAKPVHCIRGMDAVVSQFTDAKDSGLRMVLTEFAELSQKCFALFGFCGIYDVCVT